MSESIGSRLKAARESAGLSQSELARRAGLRHATVCDMEAGKVDEERVRVATVRALATALGVRASELLDGEE